MVGGSIRAAAKAAVIGGYRSAAYMRRAVIPSSHSSSAADDSRKASAIAVDDWVIPDHEVFGPVPTHEEAMVATLDLKAAFEMCVLSFCLHSLSFKISCPSLLLRSVYLKYLSLGDLIKCLVHLV